MLHPSYGELIEKVNTVNKEKEVPEINSRYSIVIAAAKRARAIIDGDKPMVPEQDPDRNVLSEVVDEMNAGKIEVIMDPNVDLGQKALQYDELAVVDFSRDMEEEE